MTGPVESDPRLLAEVAAHPYPLLFATISGAHLYGFPSPDSDFDLRGVHLLPAAECLGLGVPTETISQTHVRDGAEVDLVTHDVRKFFLLLLRGNGYVLEQLYSPLLVHAAPELPELRSIARGAITRACLRHYAGFANGEWGRFVKETPRRVKPLLYVYRVLLTGIHLLRTGEVEAHLPTLNVEARLSCVDDLVARKTAGGEQQLLSDLDLDLHERELARLSAQLEAAAATSRLPERATCRDALEDLVLRLRRASAPWS